MSETRVRQDKQDAEQEVVVRNRGGSGSETRKGHKPQYTQNQPPDTCNSV